jgi:hypothetical protein
MPWEVCRLRLILVEFKKWKSKTLWVVEVVYLGISRARLGRASGLAKKSLSPLMCG